MSSPTPPAPKPPVKSTDWKSLFRPNFSRVVSRPSAAPGPFIDPKRDYVAVPTTPFPTSGSNAKQAEELGGKWEAASRGNLPAGDWTFFPGHVAKKIYDAHQEYKKAKEAWIPYNKALTAIPKQDRVWSDDELEGVKHAIGGNVTGIKSKETAGLLGAIDGHLADASKFSDFQKKPFPYLKMLVGAGAVTVGLAFLGITGVGLATFAAIYAVGFVGYKGAQHFVAPAGIRSDQKKARVAQNKLVGHLQDRETALLRDASQKAEIAVQTEKQSRQMSFSDNLVSPMTVEAAVTQKAQKDQESADQERQAAKQAQLDDVKQFKQEKLEEAVNKLFEPVGDAREVQRWKESPWGKHVRDGLANNKPEVLNQLADAFEKVGVDASTVREASVAWKDVLTAPVKEATQQLPTVPTL